MFDYYITIPKVILDKLHWLKNDSIEVEIRNNSIFIIKKDKND
jgi:bifunctional DNA-binding transcriptional regulator/antitoxin component of YhaV-PrlF toxin-antitoxin module